MSSIGDLIKKQYDKKYNEEEKKIRIQESKITKKYPKKLDKAPSIIETKNMKRVSLWLDKELYDKILSLMDILNKDPLGKTYSNESELIRNLIRKGFPYLLSDFKRMFPKLTFPEK